MKKMTARMAEMPGKVNSRGIPITGNEAVFEEEFYMRMLKIEKALM